MPTNRFESAVDKLIKAFFSETLSKGSCTRCAVGNICESDLWANLFRTPPSLGKQDRHGINMLRECQLALLEDTDLKEAASIIEDTGYTVEEMAEVEKVFETNTIMTHTDYKHGKCTHEEFIQDQFNGLCAVVDLLCEFEGINDSEQYKDVLREKPELKV